MNSAMENDDRYDQGYGDAILVAAGIAEAWLDPEEIKLRAGEMTAQEMRSVLAVVRAIKRAIEQA